MSEEIKPKKEKRFLKTLGKVGEILLQEVLLKLGSSLIRKIGGKKTLPSILFLFLSLSLFAQYPNTGNKQRLGFQTTGDGLTWRGSISDTASIQPINNQNAWVILDTVNLKIYSFDFTSNVWNPLPQGTTLDTTSLSNRINLKLNISDTSAMLLPYAKKIYVDTAGRFYARQDFSNVSTSTLTWTQTDTLVPAGVNVVQVYRNGQILLPSQYTIPTKTSVIIAATSFKVGENYTVIFPKGGGGAGGTGIPFDTSVLNLQTRLDLKLNISDTTAMLSNYALKSYVDTSGRLYAREDFTNVSSTTLTWTQSDTLIPGGVTFVQVYRNGQILLPSQYTIPTKTSVIIAATSFKIGENYTVIFPKGGGGGGSGSGSLTSISGGTGITVSPDPITTTGTVSADLSILMELTDTSLLNLTSRLVTKLNISDTAAMLSNYNTRINTKLNISDTLSMLAPYFRDADTSSLNLTSRFALKLNAADTASLSSRINAKGTGTVTSVATGYGLGGGTITSTGTLLLDSAVVFSRIRDSIVDVAIGNDTIKILKQEYAPATTSVLTWTVTSKFPIQLKAYILVFRNGQLLINDQYNLTDTNKITIVSNSFKVGANYTVVTVSGIGSVGTGVFPNPVYPEAGIAVSTGSAWASSVPNNSANWNIAFNDKITNAAFSGTTTKTLTLTQYDGGTFAPTFTDLQGVTGVTAGTGLTGGTITTTGTVAVDFGVVAPLANPTFTGTVSGITKSMVGLGNVDNTSDANKPISTATQTALNLKFNTADTTLLNLASRFATKLNYTDTSFLFTQSDTNQLNLTSRFVLKANLASPTFTGTVSGITKSMVGLGNVDNTSDANKPISTATQTALNLKLNTADTASMLTPYFRDADTSQLNLTSRFAAKLNISDTASMLTNYLRSGVASSTYLTQSNAALTYLPLSGGTLTGTLNGTKLNLDAGIDVSGNFSTSYHTNVSALFRGYQVLVAPNNDYGSTRLHFPNRPVTEGFSDFGSGIRHKFDGSDARNSFTSLYTSNSANLQIDAVSINSSGNVGIRDTTPSYTLDINGTLGVSGNSLIVGTLGVTGNITEGDYNVLTNLDTASLSSRIDSKYNSSGGTISGAVTLSTTTATPSTLLGKDGSNVVGAVTTVAQTGLMTRGLASNLSTISGSELINVTHNLGSEPTSVLVTVFGNTSYILQVSSKASNTFTVQVKNYDGTPAINATLVSFSWLAIK